MRATITITDTDLVIDLPLWSRIWSFKSRLAFPLVHVVNAEHIPDAGRMSKGWKLIGTQFPSVITSGTFSRKGDRIFWDIRSGRNAVVIYLRDEKYGQVIVETNDPEAAVALINDTIRSP